MRAVLLLLAVLLPALAQATGPIFAANTDSPVVCAYYSQYASNQHFGKVGTVLWATWKCSNAATPSGQMIPTKAPPGIAQATWKPPIQQITPPPAGLQQYAFIDTAQATNAAYVALQQFMQQPGWTASMDVVHSLTALRDHTINDPMFAAAKAAADKAYLSGSK